MKQKHTISETFEGGFTLESSDTAGRVVFPYDEVATAGRRCNHSHQEELLEDLFTVNSNTFGSEPWEMNHKCIIKAADIIPI